MAVIDSSDNTIGPAHNLSKTTGPHKSLAERHAGVIHTVMPRNVSWGPPDADLVYSCGKNWIPVEDFQSDNGVYAGFASAVSVFCTIAGDQVEVESDGYFSQTVREAGGRAIGLNGGKDPRHNARVGRVECAFCNHLNRYRFCQLNADTRPVEIHNKQERTHKPNCQYAKHAIFFKP